jgi:uncharacterized protein
MSQPISHEDNGRDGAFFMLQDGVRIAEMTYRHAGDGVANFDHTFVDPSLRGKGVARALFDAAIAWVRERNLRIVPACSYVRAQFARDASLRDLLA